jgi:hypothetical protein
LCRTSIIGGRIRCLGSELGSELGASLCGESGGPGILGLLRGSGYFLSLLRGLNPRGILSALRSFDGWNRRSRPSGLALPREEVTKKSSNHRKDR